MKTACYRRFWRIVHNVLIHPLMEVLPDRLRDYLHDTTAAKAFD